MENFERLVNKMPNYIDIFDSVRWHFFFALWCSPTFDPFEFHIDSDRQSTENIAPKNGPEKSRWKDFDTAIKEYRPIHKNWKCHQFSITFHIVNRFMLSIRLLIDLFACEIVLFVEYFFFIYSVNPCLYRLLGLLLSKRRLHRGKEMKYEKWWQQRLNRSFFPNRRAVYLTMYGWCMMHAKDSPNNFKQFIVYW